MTAVDSHGSVAHCTFDHHDSSVRGDEYYALYEQLRGPGVAWSDHYGGFWVVADYDDARAVLKDHSTFSSADGCFLPDMGYRSVALEQDPPEHTLFRKLFVSGVGRGAVLRHEVALDEMIRRVVGEFVAAGGGDAREMISERIPVEAVALMFGLSAPAAARVRELTTEAWKRIATDPNAMAPMTEMLLGEVASRRAEPQDDFLTLLLDADIAGQRLTEPEIGNVLVGAVIAGHETTMNASTNLLHELAVNPELQRRLREHPDEIPAAVEECLRHRAPIHLFFRTATKPVSLRGAQIQPGDKVAVLYASANRDPARFAAADRFDLSRDDNAHLSFGWGIHRCVGAYLAQTELRLLARVLLDAGTIVPDGEAESAPLEGGHHMGFKYLPLKFVPYAHRG